MSLRQPIWDAVLYLLSLEVAPVSVLDIGNGERVGSLRVRHRE